MKPFRRQTSLRTQLILTIVFCWVLPILITAASGSYLLYRNYEHHMRQELDQAGSYAIEQTSARFETILFESKTVSYDGVVRSAYRTYQIEQDSAALYRTVSNYLSQRFSRCDSVSAIFLTFWEAPEMTLYMSNQGEDPSRTILTGFAEIEGAILNDMADSDTKVRLYEEGGVFYAARNLLDSRLKPYATVVIQCNMAYLSDPMRSLNLVGDAYGEIDGIMVPATGSFQKDVPHPNDRRNEFLYSRDIDGHRITIHTRMRDRDIFNDMREMPIMIGIATALMLVLLVSLVWFFSKRVSGPIRTLVDATGRVRMGDRGYLIKENADSREFEALYRHFNAMSEELKNQFDRAMEEQEILHQARIKALQSQINPHFLNNTLEIINWEARIEGNERINAMIESLATMLSTSLNRDDNPKISFSEEMRYTEAYLYIIKQRMGDRLQVTYDIDDTLYEKDVPRMILQPLVENAIEHDLSRSPGGRLLIRARYEEDRITMRVEHDGHILDEDRKKLDRLLGDSNEPGDRVHIGIRNVNQRLRLLYGDRASLRIEETDEGIVRAEIVIPTEDK